VLLSTSSPPTLKVSSELDTISLVNSRSEANDLALRIARAHAEKKGIAKKPKDVICLDSAYHGHTEESS